MTALKKMNPAPSITTNFFGLRRRRNQFFQLARRPNYRARRSQTTSA